MSDTMSDIMSDIMSDTMGYIMSDTLSDVMSDIMSETMSDKYYSAVIALPAKRTVIAVLSGHGTLHRQPKCRILGSVC